MIVQLSDDAEIDLLVAIAFYEKHGTHVGDLFLVSISKDIGKNSGTVPGFFPSPGFFHRVESKTRICPARSAVKQAQFRVRKAWSKCPIRWSPFLAKMELLLWFQGHEKLDLGLSFGKDEYPRSLPKQLPETT